jgi:hypothetical protein
MAHNAADAVKSACPMDEQCQESNDDAKKQSAFVSF